MLKYFLVMILINENINYNEYIDDFAHQKLTYILSIFIQSWI